MFFLNKEEKKLGYTKKEKNERSWPAWKRVAAWAESMRASVYGIIWPRAGCILVPSAPLSLLVGEALARETGSSGFDT